MRSRLQEYASPPAAVSARLFWTQPRVLSPRNVPGGDPATILHGVTAAWYGACAGGNAVEEQGVGALLLSGSRELGLTPTSSGESLGFSKTTPVQDSPRMRDNSPHFSTDRVASGLSEHEIPDLYVASFLEARPLSSCLVVRRVV